MRRLPSVLLLGALALATTAFAPAPRAPAPAPVEAAPAPAEAAQEVVVCVRFRDWDVPLTDITWEAPYRRFCVATPDLPWGDE